MTPPNPDDHKLPDDLSFTDMKIDGVHMEEVHIEEPFIQTASRFAHLPGTVILLSGGDLDCARYHILAAKPWLTFSGHGQNMTLRVDDRQLDFRADPFNALRMILRHYGQTLPGLPVPVASGLFGYLAYDLKDHLEKLPRTSIDDRGLPQVCFFSPALLLVHDKVEQKTFLCIPRRCSAGMDSVEADREVFYQALSADLPTDRGFGGNTRGFKSNFKKDAYMASIKKIKDYIASGHVYQVNMSQRFEMGFSGDGFSLFTSLYQANPAPFFSYIQAGDHQIVSTSPERFIRQNGTRVETRPIKGTRPRGRTREEDESLGRELFESRKDDAELSMIVDLLRNDIGRVCRGGSVRVAEHKRLEAYENVFHLVSIVEGDLAEEKDSVDLIAAAFPGGSITGCPKIRSMEIIDECEPIRRHIYTGSIGYIGFHEVMDLSIAIRTATIQNDKIIFSVGGGIVYDSDPGDEYDETLHKGRTLIDIFEGSIPLPDTKRVVWVNGGLTPEDEAAVPVSDRGVQYGHGFFETIRVNRGRPGCLPEHMNRFNTAWRALFFHDPPDLSWAEIIDQVLCANSLGDETAAVKIMATAGDREHPPYNHTLLVTARPYTHRLAGKTAPGLDLAIYPEPRQTPLANHKTLNYLFYYLAGRWAGRTGADEALILNPDGSISETNTANLILIKGKRVLLPRSPAVLPGVMEGAVIRFLKERGFRAEWANIFPRDLAAVDQVLMTNSLMGAVPVLTLDGKPLPGPSGLCEEMNAELL